MLERGSEAAPLYAQVARLLAAQISGGTYTAGDLLPSEPRLAKDLGVSRATIVKAFDALHHEGLIRRQQGKGTFVAPRPQPHSLTELTSFTAVTQASDATPTHRLLAYEMADVGDPRDELLDAFPATLDLAVLHRVRYSDGIAVGFHRTVIPADLAVRAGMTESVVAADGFSLYRTLAAAGQTPATAEESLRAVGCPASIAEYLGVPEGAPVMQVRRFTRSQSGELIEAVDATYDGSLYEYRTKLSSYPSTDQEGPIHEDHIDGRDGHVRVVVAERLRRHDAKR